jgi:flagellar biosynthesis protein FlhF
LSAPSVTSARRFVAGTSREALRLARENLGADAMILSNQSVAGGVEVVAMAHADTARAVELAAPMPTAAPADSVLNELHSMRGMIEEQLAGVLWNDKQKRDPVRGRLLRTLLGAGFSAGLAKAMLEHLPTGRSYAQGMEFVRSELVRATPVHQDEAALLAEGGIYALIGPTGVGKTTTTAKLAARCVLNFGAEKLALVTTDSYRIGAHEQLRIYGRILGVPVFSVKDAGGLQLVLQELHDKHMVLIDTVGMSQRDRAVSDQIAMLSKAGRPVKRLLLLNAASHGDTLNEVVRSYGRASGGAGLAGCIFTKVDEATHPGALIDTVIRHRLPVHYISNGQKVPENLVIADGAQLVDNVFRAHGRKDLFVPAEADLHDPSVPADARAEVARAQAEAERVRLQYQRLIRAMAHDAEELALAAGTLSRLDIGFEHARRLWRMVDDDQVGHKPVLRTLIEHARGELTAGCASHVLAVAGQAGLRPAEGAVAYRVHGSVLLSDLTGMPVAAPNQWLATDASGQPGARQADWLHGQDLGRTQVLVLPRLPALELLQDWRARGQHWLAPAPAATAVVDARSGAATTLGRLKLDFSQAQRVTLRGRTVLVSNAEALVSLRSGASPAGTQVPMRCIVTRTADAGSGKTVARAFSLTSLGPEVTAAQLVQWQQWAEQAEPCFRLIGLGLQAAGGPGEPGDPDLMKRLLIAGQVATTVWRLMHAGSEAAQQAGMLLIRLAGRPARSDRPLSANALFDGMGKLFPLLDALGADTAPPEEGAPE